MTHAGPPTSVNMVVNLVAALLFAILMILFWWFWASNEVRVTVQRKSEALPALRRQLAASNELKDAATLLDFAMYNLQKEHKTTAKLLEAARVESNRQAVWQYLGPYLGLVCGLLAGVVTYNVTMTQRGHPRHLEFGHIFGMFAVLLSYVPEIMLFYFVIDRYNMVGDHEVLQTMTR